MSVWAAVICAANFNRPIGIISMKTTTTWKAGLRVPLVLILEAEVTKVTETNPNCVQDGETLEGNAREFDSSEENVEKISNEPEASEMIVDHKAVR